MAVDVLSEEVVWAHELDGGGFKLPTEYGPEYGHQHQNQNQMGNSKGLLRVIVVEEGRAMLVCSVRVFVFVFIFYGSYDLQRDFRDLQRAAISTSYLS